MTFAVLAGLSLLGAAPGHPAAGPAPARQAPMPPGDAPAGAPMMAPAGSQISLPPLDYTTFTLDNGLQVLLLEDHRLPRVVVDTWYGVGSYDDPQGASGFAHLFEHLMFMGTKAVPEGRFDAMMEAAGGNNNASTGDDRTNYFDWGTSNILDLLLYMEADRMTGLDMSQEKLDLQREVVRNERRQNYEDSPYGMIWLELPQMLFPEEHPYHLTGIGSHEDLKAATLEHVTTFYKSWYAPNNASLVVVGDFETQSVTEKIKGYFGPLKSAEIPKHAPFPVVDGPVTRAKTVYDNVQLPAVVMAWHSPAYFAEGDASLDILASLLSAGADSRLVQRVVHQERLAQEIVAFQSSGQRGSQFLVMAYASPDADLDRLEAIVNEEIQAVASTNRPTAQELTQVKNSYEMSFLTGLQGLIDKAEQIQTYLYHVGRPDFLEEDLARYLSVTQEDLSGVVTTYLTPDKAAVLRVLPEPEDDTSPEGEDEAAPEAMDGGETP